MKKRLPLSKSGQWSDATSAVLSAATPAAESPDGKGPPNILYAIGHHPALLPPFLQFSSALATQGVLPRRDSEILALRTSWNCQSAFEWGHHVEYGLAAGLTEEEVSRIPIGPRDPAWSARDRKLLEAADGLHLGQDLTDSVYAALAAELDAAAIIELIFVVGNYTMLSMVANSTGVPVEDRLRPLPENPAHAQGKA